MFLPIQTKLLYKLYFSLKQDEGKNVLMMDLFLANTQLFTSQYIYWYTGLVWCF